MTLKLLAIGEAMAELRRPLNGDFKVGFAGDTYNTAIYCQRELKKSHSVGFMSRVGIDPLSATFLDAAEFEGVEVSSIARDHSRNIGIYSVETDAQGERSFAYWRDQSAARLLFEHDADLAHMPKAKIYYLSGITLAIMSPEARVRLIKYLSDMSASGDALVAFDSNFRPKLWEDKKTAQNTMAQMWEIADLGFPSIDDEMALFDDANEDAVITRFFKRKWTRCAIKRGERGPVSANLNSNSLPHFSPVSHVVDTTAAGDSFNGGYLAAFIKGLNEADCLMAGHNLASKVVGVSGAIIPKDG